MSATCLPVLELGSRTRWGTVAAILWLSGERYYLLVEEATASVPCLVTSVSLLPACVVEVSHD